LSRAALLALLAATASACSLVIGTTTRTLEVDGGEDVTGEDVTVAPEAGEAAAEDAGDGGVIVDAGPDSPPPCSVTGCLIEAGVCGTTCGTTSATCQSNCKNQNCKNQCLSTEAACRSACTATCNSCSFGAGCQNPTGCADAAAM
jgi:hypothetical protein